MNEMTPATTNATVTIISIWSKIDGLEGKLRGRDQNVAYILEVPAGPTPEATLHMAYALTNADDRPLGTKACSTTAGDIMVLSGQHYFVDWTGFKALSLAQSQAIQQLSSRDTGMGFEWLVKHHGISNG